MENNGEITVLSSPSLFIEQKISLLKGILVEKMKTSIFLGEIYYCEKQPLFML